MACRLGQHQPQEERTMIMVIDRRAQLPCDKCHRMDSSATTPTTVVQVQRHYDKWDPGLHMTITADQWAFHKARAATLAPAPALATPIEAKRLGQYRTVDPLPHSSRKET